MEQSQIVDFFCNRINYETRSNPTYNSESFNLVYARHLVSLLGNPDEETKIIHVAGTNGKGSTCFYMEQILLSSGYSVGTFLSPHVHKFNERIRINGEDITDTQLSATIKKIQKALPDKENPTTFELLLLTALVAFHNSGCQYVILETGLGGRLDATNIVSPILCLITPIALDHQHILGNTIKEIALEKAGIIKPGIPILSAKQTAEATEIIQKVAHEKNAPLSFLKTGQVTDSYNFTDNSYMINNHSFKLSMIGAHQADNLSLALLAAEILKIKYDLKSLQERLATNRLPGRVEYIAGQPAFLLDGAHNPAAILQLTRQLQAWHGPIRIITAMMHDKKIKENMRILNSMQAEIILTQIDNERTAPLASLAAECPEYLAKFPDAGQALQYATQSVEKDTLIVIAGSFYLTGELRNKILNLS